MTADTPRPTPTCSECGVELIVLHHGQAGVTDHEPKLAEARDATGLREALVRLVEQFDSHIGTDRDSWLRLSSDQVAALRAFWPAARAALAATPPEPRWPSRDELAKALDDMAAAANTLMGFELRHDDNCGLRATDTSHEGGCDCGLATAFDRLSVLAALREGAERPSTNTTTTTKEATDGR